MKKIQASLIFIMITVFLLAACSLVPLTGRRQLSLVSDTEMLSMSYAQYDQFQKENRMSASAGATNEVKRVGRNIQKAVTTYFARNKMSQELDGYAWEFNLVENKEANAWCMPGGKVMVYSGILPLAQNEAGLAVVMGHEIAHAVAKHSNERMSQALVANLGGQMLAQAIKQKPQQTQQIWMGLFGVGVQVGAVLPYNRLQEGEADRLGLIFMAMAGYDPHTAIAFWQRMSQKGGARPPEFLSTHPSDKKRMAKIIAAMPEAMKYYRK
jgi:predicted Zn-dependent protease